MVPIELLAIVYNSIENKSHQLSQKEKKMDENRRSTLNYQGRDHQLHQEVGRVVSLFKNADEISWNDPDKGPKEEA